MFGFKLLVFAAMAVNMVLAQVAPNVNRRLMDASFAPRDAGNDCSPVVTLIVTKTFIPTECLVVSTASVGIPSVPAIITTTLPTTGPLSKTEESSAPSTAVVSSTVGPSVSTVVIPPASSIPMSFTSVPSTVSSIASESTATPSNTNIPSPSATGAAETTHINTGLAFVALVGGFIALI